MNRTPASDGAGIAVEGVDVYYGALRVVTGVRLAVGPGGGVAIVGRNGVGKTTTLRAIMKAFGVRATGRVTVNGKLVTGLDTDEIARLGVAFVPSDRRIFPVSVRDNLKLAARGSADWEQRAEKAVEFFPMLKTRMDQRGDTLSGGEQQALAIARAAIMRPQYMLLDEPSEGLAPIVAQSLVAGISDLKRELSMGLIVAERNVGVVAALCDMVHGMAKGRIVMSLSASEFAADREIQHQILTPTA